MLQKKKSPLVRLLRIYPVKFHKQRIFGNFIVDFYCPKAMLVIELDGSHHYEQDTMKYDKERTTYLNSLGYMVLRFTNVDIHDNFKGVCCYIDKEVKKRIQND